MRTCGLCSRTFPLEDFYFANKAEGRRHYRCKDCINKQDTIIDRKAQRRAFIARYKEWMGCAECGYDLDARQLQFDHIEPGRFGSNGKRPHREAGGAVHQYGWRRINEFLRDPNIQVLCANCHAIKSVKEHVYG